jgi:hypothetical protein
MRRTGLLLLLLAACSADNHTFPDPMSLPCGKHFRYAKDIRIRLPMM